MTNKNPLKLIFFEGFLRLLVFIITAHNSRCWKVTFSHVCGIPSVHREGVGFPACITGHMTKGAASRGSASKSGLHPRGVCIQGRRSASGGQVYIWRGLGRTPPPVYYWIRSTSGRYTSYWSAFLFLQVLGKRMFTEVYCKLLHSLICSEIRREHFCTKDFLTQEMLNIQPHTKFHQSPRILKNSNIFWMYMIQYIHNFHGYEECNQQN